MTAVDTTPAVRTPGYEAQHISRTELLAMISAIMALLGVGIDMMLPAFDEIRAAFDLGEGSNKTGQIITVFFGGLAAGQLFFGPLADRYGRKPVLYIGIVIYIIGAAGCAIAPSFGLLLGSRFVWGVGTAGARVVATAIVRDCFEGVQMAKAMSQVMAVFVLVPILAPSLGAGIIALVPWQGVFWFCVAWAGLIALWSLRLEETMDPAHERALSLRGTLSGYAKVIRTPVTAGFTVATVFLQGVFTGYLAASELMIGEIFGRASWFPFIFGGVAIMFGIAALLNGRTVESLGIDRAVTLAIGAQFVLVSMLLVLAISTNGRPNLWVFVVILGLLLSTFMFLMPNLNSAAMTPVGHIAGSASALTGAVRMGAGAALGTIVSNQVVDSVTGFVVGVALLVLCSAVTVYVVRMRETRRTVALVPAPSR